MLVDPERIIVRLLTGSVITIATVTLMTHDFETVFGTMAMYALMLFLQEEVYEQYKMLKQKRRRRHETKIRTPNICWKRRA